MYVGVGVKLILNMHDLNNERAEEIRRVPLIYRNAKGEWQVVEEAVAVSGVMVKHWHFAYVVALGKEQNVAFCDHCGKLEAIRVPSQTSNFSTEKDFLENCAGEDIHGFLRAKPPLRRESLARFSWMLPIYSEESMKIFGVSTPFRVMQHSRNIREIPDGAPDAVKQAQMPYPRSYANGIYGFVSTLDLKHIGYSFNDQASIKDIIARRKIAIQAYVPMLTGAMGASLARSLPVSDILETVVIMSSKPIPTPVHPIYPNFISENITLYKSTSAAMETDITMYAWSKERTISTANTSTEIPTNKPTTSETKPNFKIISVDGPADGFARVIEAINNQNKPNTAEAQ